MLIARLRLTLAVSEAKCAVDAARKAGASDEAVAAIKKSAADSLPRLPIDPIYSQDQTIVNRPFRTATFAEAIEAL